MKDADIVRAVQGTEPHRRRAEKKSAPAEKSIHIPLPFDAVMSAVVKVKPQPKAASKASSKKRTK